MKLNLGSEISHFQILSPIGKGGMGEVYFAPDKKLTKRCRRHRRRFALPSFSTTAGVHLLPLLFILVLLALLRYYMYIHWEIRNGYWDLISLCDTGSKDHERILLFVSDEWPSQTQHNLTKPGQKSPDRHGHY